MKLTRRRLAGTAALLAMPSLARAIASVPMAPPAPGRFSTTKGWPKTDWKWLATARAAMSGVVPPGKPTITRTCLLYTSDAADE